MEDILARQYVLMDGIERTYINFNKDGAERKTPSSIERRINTISQYWNEFKANHMTLIDYQDVNQIYFQHNWYEATQNFYREVITHFHQYLAFLKQPSSEDKPIKPRLQWLSELEGFPRVKSAENKDPSQWISSPNVQTRSTLSVNLPHTAATAAATQQQRAAAPPTPPPHPAIVTQPEAPAQAAEPPTSPTRHQVPPHSGRGASGNSHMHNLDESNRHYGTSSMLEEKLRKQKSNFKAFTRTIVNIQCETLSDKWEFENAIKLLDSRWSTIDSLHWEIDSEQYEEDVDYERAFAMYEKQYHEMKKRLCEQMWSASYKTNSTPIMEIPIFYGDYHKWTSFKDLFEETIHKNRSMSNAQKMQYLKSKVKGEAEKLTQHLNISSDNYQVCWDILNHRYENKKLIFTSHVNILMSLPTLQQQSAPLIKKIHDSTNECLNAIKNLGVDISTWDPLIVHILSQKLDHETHKDYIESLRSPRELPSLSDFLEFLENKFTSLEASRRKQDNNQKSVNQTQAVSTRKSHSAQNYSNYKFHQATNNNKQPIAKAYHVSAQYTCAYCKADHSIFFCNEFINLSNEKKLKVTRDLRLCNNCLYDHKGNKCFSTKTCKKCTEPHNTLLHEALTKSSMSLHSKSNRHNVNVSQNDSAEILLATAEVKVQSADGSFLNMRALIDQGSQISIITENAAQKLRLPRQHCKGVVFGLGTKENSCKGSMNIAVSALYENFNFNTDVVIMKNVVNNLPSQSFENPKWSHIENISLADPQFYVSRPVDLLLGADIYALIMMGAIIRGQNEHQPIAQQTRLGWLLCGNIIRTYQCNIIINNLHDIQRFWSVEDIADNSLDLSKADYYCMEHYQKNTYRQTDGRYVVRLPMDPKTAEKIGDSKQRAIAQFLQLEKKFSKIRGLSDHYIRDAYKSFIEEYIELGHMYLAGRVDSKTLTCYLPHHCVLRESTTTALRVVFNASSPTTSGRSLNDLMYSGPNLQQDLMSLILKWRCYAVAITADIEKMFRQILVHPEDQNLQKIIWRDNIKQSLREYNLATVTYGMKAAPFLAMMTLKQLAKNEGHKYSPEATKALLEHFYMDDLLSGSHSIVSAKQLQEELIELLSSGGFKLRKWASNKVEVLRNVATLTEKRSIVEFKCPESTKTLGLQWNPLDDSFSFQIKLIPNITKPPTKRLLLSEISKIFDPLGWLSPVTTKLKLLFQKLWLLEKDFQWDSILPADIISEWQNIRVDLENINQIKIKRWLETQKTGDIELHGFCDASTKAYACVIYCRVSNRNSTEQAAVTIEAGKARLVPLKRNITLPRLELMACLLLSYLMEKVVKSLPDYNIKIFGWTDSTAALGWLHGDCERWKPFVANRVEKIRTVIPAECWRYVKSIENPADCASRGISAKQLTSYSLWWNGPAWLATYKSEPEKCHPVYKTDEEVKKCIQTNVITNSQESDVISNIVNKHSNFTRATRVLAWIRRIILRSKNKSSFLTSKELSEARKLIIYYYQNIEYNSEIQNLKNNIPIGAKSKILNLNPFLDQNQLLRVGGRIKNAHINEDMKHPLIIPHNGHLTNLLIDQAHRDTFHGGARLTLARLRQHYWIISGNRAVKKRLRNCVICRRHDPVKQTQIMGDLPAARSNPTRPFFNTGVDFTGYVDVKANKGRGIKTCKAYIAVFVCMVTKAVHLELVSDLSSSAFLAALRRMAARRGAPRHVFCDNGTNFVGASRIIKEEIIDLQQTLDDEFYNEITGMQIEFHFNAPSWPSAGGLWEAAVKSLKYHLRRVVGEQKLTYEEYSTLLAQLEACLNSRPLCAISEDPEDINYLTPSHFLASGPTLTIIETERDARTRWQLTQKIFSDVWKRWRSEYLCQLSARSKWQQQKQNQKVGDVVIIHDINLPAGKWPLGRVVELHPGKDGQVRVVSVKTKNGIIQRPIIKLSPLPVSEEAEGKVQASERPQSEIKKSTSSKQNRSTIQNNISSTFKTMAITLLTLFLILPAHCSHNIVRLNNNQSIYFDKISDMHLQRDEWKLIVYYNMDPYWNGAEMLGKCIKNLDYMCDKSKTELLCNVIMMQLRHGFKELDLYNHMLLGQRIDEVHSRTRRGLINGVGNLARTLFGVLDDQFAEQYQKDIELLQLNQNHLELLWKNHTSIVEAQNNLLKRVEETMDEQHKSLNQHMTNLQQFMSNLNEQFQTTVKNNNFALSAIIANTIMQSLKNIQDYLLDTIIDLHYGSFNVHLINPEQFQDELNIISGQLSKDLSLPVENTVTDLPKLYHMLKIKAKMSIQYFIFEIKIPLVSRDYYEIYHLIPTYHNVNNSIMNIIPIAQYVAINIQKDSYLPMTQEDILKCNRHDDATYLCPLQKPVYHMTSDNSLCVTDEVTKHCTIEIKPCKMIWSELHTQNMHLYYCCEQCVVRIICENQISLEQLKGNGIISLSGGCIIKSTNFTIYSQKQQHSVLNVNADLPEIKIPSINHIIDLPIFSANNLNISNHINYSHTYFRERLNEIGQQIQEMKETGTDIILKDRPSFHDITQYIILSIITSSVICTAIIILWRRMQKRTQTSSNMSATYTRATPPPAAPAPGPVAPPPAAAPSARARAPTARVHRPTSRPLPHAPGERGHTTDITGIGLRTVFGLVSQSRNTDPQFCELALKALFDVLQGHAPEELAQEPAEIMLNLHSMLAQVSSGSGSVGGSEEATNVTALSSSCLIALSVARGEAELILNAVASLIMSSSSLSDQYVQIPLNLTTLQRSVQSVILGPPSRNQWLKYGVPHQSLVSSFPLDLPPQLTSGAGELVVRSLVSDGCFLYVFTSKGLLKIGSGYGSSIRQHVYSYKHDFFASDRHGWLGFCKGKLYARIGRKKTEVYEIDKNTLETKRMMKLEPGHPPPVEPKSAVFSDGHQLGLIMLTNFDNLTIKLYNIDETESFDSSTTTLTSRKELNVHLLRRRTLILGRAPFEDNLRKPIELDAPVAVQLDDNDEDPLLGICTGQDFGLLTTQSGKIYYTGKGTSLGYKAATSHPERWTLMKESLITRNENPGIKKSKVIQVAVGHEGVHAILVLDNGTALFMGVSRRGEDGDASKHRRMPKPSRPKKIFKAEGHYVTQAACNYGTTALVTRQGLLLMYGKDTQHCDSTGVVTGLRHERVIQVALGKAHTVALTNFGQVYTFGINNKGQCGREFGYTKEKSYAHRSQSSHREEYQICTGGHTWTVDYCRVCVLCRECTGFESCQCAALPNRVPGEKCGCGEGESGCSVCGMCRRCAEAAAAGGHADSALTDLDDDGDTSSRSDVKSGKENMRYPQYEGHSGCLEGERDASLKASCLPPARVAIPGGHRICAVACGLHHTVVLTEHGEVLTFGSNQLGQLGAGDVSPHHRLVKVRVPRAAAVAAGSNHTAVLTRDGELYTFGNYQKGALGRPRCEDVVRPERSPIWYAVPGRVPRLGLRHACKAVWVSASGDQTFVQVSQALIKTDTLFSSTITANSNAIIILPNRPEHTFKCLTINKNDGSCNAWTGSEQVDFINSLACLDPLYDVLWCYQPQKKVMKCYNILAYDSHKVQRCCTDFNRDAADFEYEYPNYGSMKRLEDFKNLENFEIFCNHEENPAENLILSNMSVLNQELAIPSVPGCSVTRMHAALHLLGCLDSLTHAHDTKLNQVGCKKENKVAAPVSTKEDFLTVNRFESHGGGWGYSGHSIEAIRFMCDTDILLGGFGLFGGRGDYSAKIKLFDIGPDGGDQEGDGEVIAESEEIVYECAPRDKFPVLFDSPVPLAANRWYIAWACINGPSSDCGSSGQAMVINDEIGFHFKTSKKSNNGTDVNAGQIPCLLYNIMNHDNSIPIRNIEPSEPVIALSKNISRKLSVPCFKSLITLLQWSWKTFKEIMLDSNGQLPINYQKLSVMKHQKRLVYVIRACLRLVKSYINEICPQNNRKRNSYEYMSYFEAIADVRNLIQQIMADPTPSCSMLPRKPGKNKTHRICYVQFALELTNSVLKEAHETITACFHAFFPTPTLKWNHLCSILCHVKAGVTPSSQIRELTSICAAMCVSRSLRDVLQYVVPLTQSSIVANDKWTTEVKEVKEVYPSKSATVPRSSSQAPPVPPRASYKDSHKTRQSIESTTNHTKWHLLDAIPKLLDIVINPVKQQMMTRQCGQPHDHGEVKQYELLAEYCCKFIARIVAELSYSAINIREETDVNTVKHLVTPSRFMRVNQSRAWNTGNGSPDAICFTVDRPGVMLVGVCVYGGLGNYEYSLELLHDVRMHNTSDDINPAHCWVSVDVTHGTFTAADCQHDMVQIKFDKPVPLKEDLRYALRLCNHGGRTANGDCGLPSVKGPDGTTFRFASCSLSFNGTSLARGQIPCLIYYGTTKYVTNASESTDSLMVALRGITLHVASTVLGRCADLFYNLRNELTAEDLRRNALVLQTSPAISILIPYTLTSLEGLDDSKSIIKILEIIHKLLPHVAAMNLLLPPIEELTTTTTHYYTWVESDHPYKLATVSNLRVLFPPSVSWVLLEMDPRSITAQGEDSLTVYAVGGVPKQKCNCSTDAKTSDLPFRKRIIQLTSDSAEVEEIGSENDFDTPCMHYNCTYVSVTPKLCNLHSEWPQKALLVPGNEVIFSLETASDYLNDFNKAVNDDSRFGYRCLCVGYEDAPFTTQRQGLVTLEMELVFAGAACASRLLAPDLDIPPLSFGTMIEVQVMAMMGTSSTGNEGECSQDADEVSLLSRGLQLSSPPTVSQVLDGQPLARSESTERQFLMDFVAGAESTAGGRLARWLAPCPQVDITRCELKPLPGPVRPASTVTLPLLIRDQYGDIVVSPALKVEVVVQSLEMSMSCPLSSAGGTADVPDVPYRPTLRDSMCFHAITMMKAYQSYCFEELRLASCLWGERVGAGGARARVPAERLPVRAQPDGAYVASWTPRAPGTYVFRCTLDDQPAPQELTVEVLEDALEEVEDRSSMVEGVASASPAHRLRRFVGRHSSGLRVRSSPSLQAEELGRVPPGANVAFVEELTNKDGTWVRLGGESVRTFTEGCAGVAWCLQHHRHLDRTLLAPVDPISPAQCDYAGLWSGYSDGTTTQSWMHEDIIDITGNDFNYGDESEHEGSSSPFLFEAEPSKRARNMRNEMSKFSPNHFQRRSNGNSEEWWSPLKQRTSDNMEAEKRSSNWVSQTGTQTSPESITDEIIAAAHQYNSPNKDTSKMKRERDRLSRGSRLHRHSGSPPPLPSRAFPALAPPHRKQALSPAQAECLRAIFAALLWHEGIVHDAIACAAFLKFHPQLPKQGARVVTRAPHDATANLQRHSVEVSNAGQYLKINPSTLETLTRSGEEASANRARKADMNVPIREEDTLELSHSAATSTPCVVSVLPPALRALVALWDALYDADQLSAATDKLRKEELENNENDESVLYSSVRKKREWSSANKVPYSVKCELCGSTRVPPPLSAHMKNTHPGCRVPSSKGYDRSGYYRKAEHPFMAPAVCGQLAQASGQLWYMFCDKCRDKTMKAASSIKQMKSKMLTELGYEPIDIVPEVDHQILKENAMFLLDLAPLTNSESLGSSRWEEGRSSPPTPPGSIWQPAPPFQCLAALGVAPKPAPSPDTARYYSLGRPPAPFASAVTTLGSEVGTQWPRVHRSVSMGQEGGRDLVHATRLPASSCVRDTQHDTLSGVGSSLLAQPSAVLQKLVGCGECVGEGCSVSAFEPPHVDPYALMRRPVLTFILAKRDLHSLRQKMDAIVRINTIRQYALEALNWLLRSATQPTCVHDVMWWFCNALDKYARTVPSPLTIEDTKESGGECNRYVVSTASASALCPGGLAGRGARAAFHALLGSISALAPSLPPASPVALQAVRCWAMHYSNHDRSFLHRSQVFSVISKILSHSEEGAYEDGVLGALHDSFHSYYNKENYVWKCPDVSSWCEVSVSSRQGMAGALTDGSTETFWESGDEDRNKAKWIQVAFARGTPEDRPHIVCLHLDNTRDTVNKTLLVSFLYSGGSSEMMHMEDIEVDPQVATWLCYTLPKVRSLPARVRCELRGPEAAVRVRQVRVLGAPAPAPASPALTPAAILHSLTEADTLRVFRLLTTQVFGKLLEWDRNGSESNGEGTAVADDAAVADDSDLREHVVGILFAGHKLTSLQRQVMSHIVTAIGGEAGRARDDWDSALLSAETRDDAAAPAARHHHHQDNYCFEMLSLLLALSGSAVGRAHLAQRLELLGDLLTLLHTGSERVQRQVISLLRRMITEVPPQKVEAAINYGYDTSSMVTLVDHLVCYLGKAITMQVKVKGAAVGANGSANGGGGAATLGDSVIPAPPAAWFMRGHTTHKHAHLVARLLADMAEEKVSPYWGCATRAALAGYIRELAQTAEGDRAPVRCLAHPPLWMAVAALCICEQAYLDSSEKEKQSPRRSEGGEARALCVNHDDECTAAMVECRQCGPLCAECDRFLHLNRAARTHHRQICKEEESAVRIDIHEGCGRAKLFWVLVLVDRRTLKALAEFRAAPAPAATTGAPLAGACRFCGARANTGLLAIGNVCADHQCQEYGRASCNRVLGCGHACGGVRGERTCLPCLFGCAGAEPDAPLRQDADDMCMICFTDPLQAAPAIQLKCGHVFHLHCCKKVLANKWVGPRITFSFAQCPICKEDMNHWTLEEALAPIRALREEVRRKALMRLEYEGAGAAAGAGGGAGGGAGVRGRALPDPAAYAMERYAYYVCHKCGKAYFGGMARCEAESSGRWEAAELVCGGCSDVAGARSCPKHGADFLEYKCRYCCSVAVFFCFGTSHFCNACHDDFQRVTNIPKHLLPQCPAGPKGEQLPGTAEECPLHVRHPPTGEEFALGCGVCRHAHAF